MNLGELFIKLGFDVDDKKLKQFKEDVRDGFTGLLKLSGAAAGAVYAINRFTSGSIEQATTLQNLRNQTDLSTESVQRLANAATMANTQMTFEEAIGGIQQLYKSLGEIQMGGGPIGAASMFNIQTQGKDALEVIQEVREKYEEAVQAWGLAPANNMLEQMGLGSNWLNLIQSDEQQFQQWAESRRVMSDEEIDRLAELGRTYQKTANDYKNFRDELTLKIQPGIMEALDTSLPVLKDFSNNLETVYDSIAKLPNALDTVKVSAAALLVVLRPVIAAIAALAWIADQTGSDIRGEETFRTKYGKKLADLVRGLPKDWDNFVAAGQQAGDELNERGRKPQPENLLEDGANERARSSGFRGLNTTSAAPGNMYNTFNIDSNQDTNSIAKTVVENQQRVLNYTLSQKNNGPAY